MKSWVWILAAIAVALLLLGFAQNTREGFTTLPDAKCSDGTISTEQSLKCPNTGKAPVCPSGSSLYRVFTPAQGAAIKCVPNSLVYDSTFDPSNPMVKACKNDTDAFSVMIPASGILPTPDTAIRKCVKMGPTPVAPGNDISRTSGTTTGGTTGSTQGPNSGGGGDRRKQVFGPLFMGEGEGGVKGADSSKTNKYPQLLGGDGGKASTLVDGAGIVAPTLPFSIEPGDMELIPDPYRVSQQFSTSSYSSKTEPVPFLTDFSAFQT